MIIFDFQKYAQMLFIVFFRLENSTSGFFGEILFFNYLSKNSQEVKITHDRFKYDISGFEERTIMI